MTVPANETRTNPELNNTDIAKQRLRLWLRLLKLTRPVEAELRERLRREFGTTLPRFDVLAALARHPDGLRMSELSQLLMVSNGNVTGLVDRLTEDGLMTRSAVSGDRRAFVVTLSKQGRAEFERQASVHQQWIDELLGELDSEAIQLINPLLQRATQRITRQRDKE